MKAIFLSRALEALMSVYSDPKLNMLLPFSMLFIAITMMSGVANAQSDPPLQRKDVLIIPPDRIIQGTINGQPVRYEFTGSLPSYFIIDPEVAMRLGLKAGFLPALGRSYNTGKISFGKSAKVDYTLGSKTGRRHVVWHKRPDAKNGDISLGLSSIQEPIVTFVLRPQRPSERLFILPLNILNEEAPGTAVKDGKNEIFITFDFRHEANVANASMAVNLVAENGGGFITEEGQILTTIRDERPARTLKLGRPLTVGPLQLSLIDVLTNARGNAKRIPNANAKVAPAKDDEILVVARKKVKRGNEDAQFLSIGTKALSACSSITFDRKIDEIRLSCVVEE
jgi:hypothetical protein